MPQIWEIYPLGRVVHQFVMIHMMIAALGRVHQFVIIRIMIVAILILLSGVYISTPHFPHSYLMYNTPSWTTEAPACASAVPGQQTHCGRGALQAGANACSWWSAVLR
jgi:hypothetical protein